MSAGERIPCLRRVIKPPCLPTIWRVTLHALGAEPAFVVRILVAAVTCHRRVLEAWCAMTFLAGNPSVKSNQRETCHVVIECHLLTPTGFLVALLTARAQLPFVGVIFFVATRAIGCKLVAIQIPSMTRVALDGSMLTPEREFRRLVMIE